VRWSPDSRYLASGSTPGLIILWDGATFDRVVRLRADTREIRSLSFSRDGRFLAGGAYVAPTIVWDFDDLHARLRELGVDW